MTFAVEASDGAELARGKDLAALQQKLAAPARRAVAAVVAVDLERTGLRSWPDDLDDLPNVIERTIDGRTVRAYPAFVDTGGAVDLRAFSTSGEQQHALRPGIRRLARISVPTPVKAVERQLDPRTRLLLGTNPDGSLSALINDCADAAVDATVTGAVWTRDAFATLRDRVGKDLVSATVDIVGRVEKVLAVWREIQLALPTQHPDALADIQAHVDRLLPPGFVTATGTARLPDLTRYLTAARRRLEQLPKAPKADSDRMARVHAVEDAYDELLRAIPAGRKTSPDIIDIGWQIEELRVSLWAQQLGTPRPVSEQRIYRAIDDAAQNG